MACFLEKLRSHSKIDARNTSDLFKYACITRRLIQQVTLASWGKKDEKRKQRSVPGCIGTPVLSVTVVAVGANIRRIAKYRESKNASHGEASKIPEAI